MAAVDTRSNERVALKLIKGEQSHNTELVKRFFREARAAMAVDHPNVVRIRDVFVGDQGEPVMVMDYLVGESLGDRIERVGKLSLRDFASLFVPVVSAVGSAHAQGIVHRDLKPDNIFVVKSEQGDESPRVLDFGIAKLTAIDGDAKQTAGLTGTGAMLGTPYYMSPEQVFGDKQIDHRADIWSLGVIVFQCLSATRPIDGDNIGQLLRAITTGNLPKLRQREPSLPEEVLELCERMLSFDKERRPRDLREVLNVFRRYSATVAPGFGEATTLDAPVSLAETISAGGPVYSSSASPLAETQADIGSPGSAQALPQASGGGVTGNAMSNTNPAGAAPKRGRAPIVMGIGLVAVLGVAGVGFAKRDALLPARGPAAASMAASTLSSASAASVPSAVPSTATATSAAAAASASAPAPAAAAAVSAPVASGRKPLRPLKPLPASSSTTTATTNAAAQTAAPGPLQPALGTENPYNK